MNNFRILTNADYHAAITAEYDKHKTVVVIEIFAPSEDSFEVRDGDWVLSIVDILAGGITTDDMEMLLDMVFEYDYPMAGAGETVTYLVESAVHEEERIYEVSGIFIDGYGMIQ